jgi:hypothetical protein
VYINFLTELSDAPLAAFVSEAAAGDARQRQLLDTTLRLLAAVAKRDEQPAAYAEASRANVPPPPRPSLTAHELACLFAPVFVGRQAARVDDDTSSNVDAMNRALKQLRSRIAALTQLIEKQHAVNDAAKQHHSKSKTKKKSHSSDTNKSK